MARQTRKKWRWIFFFSVEEAWINNNKKKPLTGVLEVKNHVLALLRRFLLLFYFRKPINDSSVLRKMTAWLNAFSCDVGRVKICITYEFFFFIFLPVKKKIWILENDDANTGYVPKTGWDWSSWINRRR